MNPTLCKPRTEIISCRHLPILEQILHKLLALTIIRRDPAGDQEILKLCNTEFVVPVDVDGSVDGVSLLARGGVAGVGVHDGCTDARIAVLGVLSREGLDSVGNLGSSDKGLKDDPLLGVGSQFSRVFCCLGFPEFWVRMGSDETVACQHKYQQDDVTLKTED